MEHAALLLTSPSMYFSRQMAQSEVELLLSESEAPQLVSLRPFPLALNFLVSIFSKAWMAILFMELCIEEEEEEGETRSEGEADICKYMCNFSSIKHHRVISLSNKCLSKYQFTLFFFAVWSMQSQKVDYQNHYRQQVGFFLVLFQLKNNNSVTP